MATNTKDLESLVAKAQEATKNLDDELRRVAFERVLDHLLVTSGHVISPAPNQWTSAQEETGISPADLEADGVLADEQQRTDELARYFKINPEEVEHIFDASEGEPKLAIASKHLPGPKAQATREITLLVAGALTALGLETTTSHIRDVADDYGKLNSNHFMATLTSLDEISVLGRSGSRNRVVRMKVAGAEAAQGIAQRIVN